jgi:aspartate carbamoyltransferase regulatory subunit
MTAEGIMIDNAKIMSKGQVTIPKEIRGLLKVNEDKKIYPRAKALYFSRRSQ